VQTSYIIRTDVFNPDESISTFEDFYQFLNIINKGLNTIYCSKHLIDCGAVGKGKGGLQSFDRSEMAQIEINKFKAIDPTITTVSKPEKAWKHEPKFTGKKYKSRAI